MIAHISTASTSEHISEGHKVRVFAIIVTYKPDQVKLGRLLGAIQDQVDKIEIIDNTDANVGLAAALNKGIASAILGSFSHVLLMDQDSLPGDDMVAALLADEIAAQRSGKRVGAIGPALIDTRSGRPYPFVRYGFPRNQWITSSEMVECDFVITSGSLISLASLQEIGPMNAALFIDSVDIEWCFRAKSKGFSIFGSANATMGHEIGDSLIKVPGFGRKQILVHGPVRLYYIMRNRILLYWMPHVTPKWVAQDLLRIPFKFIIFALLVPGRWDNVRHMARGIWHGLIGRSGPHS